MNLERSAPSSASSTGSPGSTPAPSARCRGGRSRRWRGDRLDYDRGRTGAGTRRRSSTCASASAQRSRAVCRPARDARAHPLDDRRLRDRLRRARDRPGDEVVTTDVEHFGLLGPLAATGASRPAGEAARPASRGGARRDRRRAEPGDEADRRLPCRLDDRPGAAVGELAGSACRCCSTARSRSARSRCAAGRAPRSTPSRARNGSSGPGAQAGS